VLAYAGWCAIIYFKQDDMIFPRTLAGPGMPQLPARPDFEQVWITTDDGVMVEGWFYRAFGASVAKPAPCIIVLHGNGDLIDTMNDYADFFLTHGLNVLLVEYRGYARSGGESTPAGRPRGEPSEQAIVADTLKFVEWLQKQPVVNPNKLVYYGRSLGTGVAAQLATRHQPAAVILESPFTSLSAFAAGFGVPPFFVKHPFRTDHALPPLAAAGLPVLIFHSRDDEIVPFSHGEHLAHLMPAATFVEVTGTHNGLMLAQPAYEGAIWSFLVRVGAAKP